MKTLILGMVATFALTAGAGPRGIQIIERQRHTVSEFKLICLIR